MVDSATGRQEALRRLVDRGVLTSEQAEAVLAELRSAEPGASGGGRWWVEAAGYVGGGLVLAGAATLLGISWEALTHTGKTLVLAGASAALLLAALVVGGGPASLRRLREGAAPSRRNVIGVLSALAAGPAAFAAGVAVNGQPDVVAPAVGLVVAVAGYAYLRTAPGLLAAALLSVITLISGLGDISLLTISFAMIALGCGWIALTLSGLVVPTAFGLGAGAAIAIIGAQLPLDTHPVWAYGFTFAVAVACLVLHRWRRTVILLIAGVVGVTVAVPEAVWDVTGGAGGGALALIVGGLVLLIASGIGFRLHRSEPADDQQRRASA